MLENTPRNKLILIERFLTFLNVKNLAIFLILFLNITTLHSQYSIKEKDELYIEYLIKNTSLGYSLYSTKPVSIYSSPKLSKIHYIFQVHNLFKFPILFLSSPERVSQRFLKMNPSKNFKLFQVESFNASHVVLINYISLKKELVKHKIILEKITHSNVRQLLSEICRPDFWIKKQNQILLGIILGYEYENALAFASGIHKKQLFNVTDYFLDGIYDIGFIANSNDASTASLKIKYQTMKTDIQNIFKDGNFCENFLKVYYK